MKSTDKKVKTVEEAVKEVVEGKPTVQNIELQRAVTAEDFYPSGQFVTLYQHNDIAGYSVGDKFVAVMDKNGGTFIYILGDIDRIYHYSVEVQ